MLSSYIPPEIFEPEGEAAMFTVLTLYTAVGALVSACGFMYEGFVNNPEAQNNWGSAMVASAALAYGGLAALRRMPATRNWFNRAFMPPGLE